MISPPKELYVNWHSIIGLGYGYTSIKERDTQALQGAVTAHYRLVTPPKPKREAIAYVIWLDGRGYVHTSQHTTRLLSLAQRFVTRQEAGTAALSWLGAHVVKLVRKAGAK